MRSLKFFLALSLLSLPLLADFLPGYEKYRFFMTPAEVKDILVSNQAPANEITETTLELVQYPYVTQDFTYYDFRHNLFLPFQFASNIPSLIKSSEHTVRHLTSLEAKHFKQVTLSANVGAQPPREWELKFVFYASPIPRKENITNLIYQLIAIVSSFKGGKVTGDLAFLPPGVLKWVDDELHQQFGTPAASEVITHDRQSTHHRQSYSTTKSGRFLIPYRHEFQVVATWIEFGVMAANLQITRSVDHFNADYLSALSTGIYEMPDGNWKSHLRSPASAVTTP